MKFSVCLPLLFVYSLLFIWVVKNLTTSFVGMIAVCSIFLAFRYKLDSNNCFYLFSPSLEIYRKPKTNLLCRWHFVAIKIWYFGLTDATKTCLGSSNFRQKKNFLIWFEDRRSMILIASQRQYLLWSTPFINSF